MPIKLIEMALTVLVAIIGSTGLWNFISTRREKHDAKTKLLVGLAHDRIVYLGMKYIERGYITRDEYENLNDYLYVPYAAAGGNGSARDKKLTAAGYDPKEVQALVNKRLGA